MGKTNTPNLTYNMEKVLLQAAEEGFVIAGSSCTRSGMSRTINAMTMKALARDGLLSLDIGPDGGMMGRTTELGIKLAVEHGAKVSK